MGVKGQETRDKRQETKNGAIAVFIFFLLLSPIPYALCPALYAQEQHQPYFWRGDFQTKSEFDGKPLYLQSFVEPVYDEAKGCYLYTAIVQKGKDLSEGFVVYEVGMDERSGSILFKNELKLSYDPTEAFKKAYTAAIDMIKSFHPSYRLSLFKWDYLNKVYRFVVFYRPQDMSVDSWYCQIDVSAENGAITMRMQGLYR